MKSSQEELFKRRINYKGDISDISLQICKNYNIGDFKSNNLILTGYEDFNYILETEDNKYFVKIFSNFRTLSDCKRYIDVMISMGDANISTPKLYESNNGYLDCVNIGKNKLRLCLAEFVDGKTIYESSKDLDKKDIRCLSDQAALINSTKIKPKFIYDHWAIPNFPAEYKVKSKYLSDEDIKTIKPLVKKFKQLEIQKLPHCFVHGDMIATNVMRDNNGKLWIIDFSVSNYYPRIQEMAVLGCNLLFDENNRNKSEENLDIALKEYQKRVPLTERELHALSIYIEIAHAMHVLPATFQKVHENNQSAENEYWLRQGRAGLRQASE